MRAANSWSLLLATLDAAADRCVGEAADDGTPLDEAAYGLVIALNACSHTQTRSPNHLNQPIV